MHLYRIQMLYACINRWKYTGFTHGYASMAIPANVDIHTDTVLHAYLRNIGANYVLTMTEEEYAVHAKSMTPDYFVPLPPHAGLCIKVL